MIEGEVADKQLLFSEMTCSLAAAMMVDGTSFFARSIQSYSEARLGLCVAYGDLLT